MGTMRPLPHHTPLQVDIEINGEPVDLQMKLGDSGEAFFVQKLESDEVSTCVLHTTCPFPSLEPPVDGVVGVSLSPLWGILHHQGSDGRGWVGAGTQDTL